MLTEKQKDRYQRHLIIPGFSEKEQEALIKASVLVIGAGGLGAPVLQYLCAAGIGSIGIVDNDKVSLSNLQRQVLFTENDEGLTKVEVAANRLTANNSDCKIEIFPIRWELESAEKIARDYDLIIDCTDNYLSRITTDITSIKCKVPFVYGAINAWEGQVSVFNFNSSMSYSEAFNITPENTPELKGAIGVLGVTPAVVGSMQAAEAIKIITGQGDVLAGRILHISLKTNHSYMLDL